MSVLVDVDDVILDLVPTWVKFYNEEFNDVLTKNNIKDWNIVEFIKPEASERMFEYVGEGKIFLEAPVIENSLYGVNVLKEAGQRVIYVTAGDPHNFKERRLIQEGFLENVSDYIVARDKSVVMGTYMIDDNYKNVVHAMGKAWLFNAPWNKKFEYRHRVRNWLDIINKIKSGEFFE